MHPLRVAHALLRGHALRGGGLTHKVAQALTGEKQRSGHWSTVERRWKAAHPDCGSCGSHSFIQVHHVLSFNTHPPLELEDCSGIPPGTGPVGGMPNFISLCAGGCHLGLGHGGSFAGGGYNPRVREDAAELLAHPERKVAIFARAKAARVTV